MRSIRCDIVTIFPTIFDSYLEESLVRRARAKGLIDVRVHDLRDFSREKHKHVDDKPFGGGPGMVLKVEPIFRAVERIKSNVPSSPGYGRAGKSLRKRRISILRSSATGLLRRSSQFGYEGWTEDGRLWRKKSKVRTILFSTRGKKLDAKVAKRLSRYERLILLCGRYEGVDERVAEHIADEEISVGDYVLSGGELPALVLMEAVSRFLPGFLGKRESLEEVKGSYPVYTRPEMFSPRKGIRWKVPGVLLSGNHERITAWRRRR